MSRPYLTQHESSVIICLKISNREVNIIYFSLTGTNSIFSVKQSTGFYDVTDSIQVRVLPVLVCSCFPCCLMVYFISPRKCEKIEPAPILSLFLFRRLVSLRCLFFSLFGFDSIYFSKFDNSTSTRSNPLRNYAQIHISNLLKGAN